MKSELIIPEWPAPANVRAASTTRIGGVSQAPFDQFNIAGHVGDDPGAVAENRQNLVDMLSLPEEPHWLSQVHGKAVVTIEKSNDGVQEGDAAMTQNTGCVCAVQTADCLPVLFCDKAGTKVAAAHAGWRGLAAGVLEATVESMATPGEDILAWLGPAIGPSSFEVGQEVYQAFVSQNAELERVFRVSTRPGKKGHWFADLYQLAKSRLSRVGVTEVYGGGLCTFEDPERFYSFRREGQTGRMASLIWMVSGSADE